MNDKNKFYIHDKVTLRGDNLLVLTVSDFRYKDGGYLYDLNVNLDDDYPKMKDIPESRLLLFI